MFLVFVRNNKVNWHYLTIKLLLFLLRQNGLLQYKKGQKLILQNTHCDFCLLLAVEDAVDVKQ